MRIVAAPDKFKGTATAREVSSAVARAAVDSGHGCIQIPLADGGDGTLDVLGGGNRESSVTGPLGEPVVARWRFDRGVAVIEMARTSGLVLAGGREGNDPLGATTAGVGELIGEAVDAGAETIIIGVGGSATTDGGLGAVEALGSAERIRGVDVVVACDVRTRFVDAASVFGPQKGATGSQVVMLENRLRALTNTYRSRFGVDVSTMDRAGAAGGLAGGLAAIGARLVDGFDIISRHVDLASALETADLVVTGEGFIDEESFDGKVVGGVLERAAEYEVDVLAVAGEVFDEADAHIDAISLALAVGIDRAMNETTAAIYEVMLERLST